jgi:carboxypeptidase Taq
MIAYQQLERIFGRLAALGDAEGFLHWDSAVMMPPSSAASRAEQIAALQSVRHGLITDPEIADLLGEAESRNDLTDWQQANVREMRRRWLRQTALNADLVEARAKASSACESKWRDARPKGDFSLVKNELQTLLNLVRESAQACGEVLDCDPYDALLDQYTPGLRKEIVEPLFDRLAEELPGRLRRILDAQSSGDSAIEPEGPFPIEAQRALGKKLMAVIGFDFDMGRLDESLHPFSGGTPDDLRITTRYDESEFMSGLMGVLHETGHALYEKGLPKDWRLQPVGEARGMDIHESQSLLIDMQACRSLEFLTFASPLMQEAFGRSGPEWSPENLYRVYTRVEPGLIRVDADEVTYPMHVILRYRLEQALLSGDLPLDDLPGAWNEGMQELLGLTPPNDQDGCLQDIHWFDGAFGYFPSYTFGALTAAQFFAAATESDGDILPGIGRGDFKPLYAWLGENVHGWGSLLEAPELIRRATGKDLDAGIFLTHLERRYLA